MTFAVLSGAAGTNGSIDLAVGSQRQVATGRTLQRIAVGDPSVVDVLVMKGSRAGNVLLVAKAPGSTNVMLWERGRDEPTVWNVNVVDAAALGRAGRRGTVREGVWRCGSRVGRGSVA